MRWTRRDWITRLIVPGAIGTLLFLMGCTAGLGNADLVAENNSFNKSTLRVRADAEVSIVFENKDNTTHNFSVYTTAESAQVIFKGEALAIPGTITYTFTAPETPGTYYFQCDFHPSLMNGRFIVSGTAS
jgi:plastocyanin